MAEDEIKQKKEFLETYNKLSLSILSKGSYSFSPQKGSNLPSKILCYIIQLWLGLYELENINYVQKGFEP